MGNVIRKPCRYGHNSTKNDWGHCLECNRLKVLKYLVKSSNRAKHNATNRRVKATTRATPEGLAKARLAGKLASRAGMAKARTLGLCVRCLKRPAKTNCVSCQICLDYSVAVTQPLRKARMTTDISAAEKAEIKLLYQIAKRVSSETGIKHEVDHIKPLSKGGLHIYANLQLLTKAENASKGARYG